MTTPYLLMTPEEQERELERQRMALQRSQLAAQQPQAQGAQGGVNPLQMAQTYNQIAPMWGGEPLWGGQAAAAPASAAPATAPASAGGGSTGAGAGMGAAAWPAALAAVIAANETWANSQGRRPDDFGEHVGDMFTGKVLERDADALSEKMPGPLKGMTKLGGQLAHPKGVYDAGADAFSWFKGLF